ncbi:sugar kinase [Streptosporangium sp. NPDC023825]|uniref:sugar kinase n=1 Tax=Streptosporangium sp. NPDC023825 TaxID=3154909 RepID=UPI003437BBED
MHELVTLGEAMAVVRSTAVGLPRPGSPAEISFAGAEATVAVGMSRLGHRTCWIGRLGDDDAGDMITATLRGEGVDVGYAVRDAERPTGLMLRHRRTADRVSVAYYRQGLAGASLSPADLPVEVIRSARLIHLTGITAALGDQAAAAVERGVLLAREAGVTVSFDVNYRSLLWPADRARPVLSRLASMADIVFAGQREAELVTGTSATAEHLAGRLLETGARQAVIKLGSDGALAADGRTVERRAAPRVTEIDPVGAGDAFVAGYLSAFLDGEGLGGRLEHGVRCGAFAVSVTGDWEGLPRRRELTLLDADDNVTR